MLIKTIIIYIIFSVLLFFIQNLVDDKSKYSYMDNVVISNIYIIILAGILKSYHIIDNVDNIFLVVLFELLFRLFYSNYVRESNFFKDNKDNVNKYLLIIITSVLINNLFINKTRIVFPKMENVKIIIWLVIVMYLYNFFKDNIKINIKKNNSKNDNLDKEKIIINYAKYSNRYYNVINTKYKELVFLIYAIMIYEDSKRPEFMRKVDKLKYKLSHQKREYGIMQVDSYYPIDDIKSINLSIKHIEKIYSRLKNREGNRKGIFCPGDIILKYYKNNVDLDKIIYIYDVIIQFKSKEF